MRSSTLWHIASRKLPRFYELLPFFECINFLSLQNFISFNGSLVPYLMDIWVHFRSLRMKFFSSKSCSLEQFIRCLKIHEINWDKSPLYKQGAMIIHHIEEATMHCSEKATKEEKGVSDLHGAFSSLACENIGFTYWPQWGFLLAKVF